MITIFYVNQRIESDEFFPDQAAFETEREADEFCKNLNIQGLRWKAFSVDLVPELNVWFGPKSEQFK